MSNLLISKSKIFRLLFWLLLVCSIWLTISVFVFIRFDAPINFAHVSIIISLLTIFLIYRQKISLSLPHALLLLLFSYLIFLSLIKGFFIKPETVTYINKTFLTHYLYKTENYPKFNSIFLYFKELFHLFFTLITIFVASIIIKKSDINLDDFKYYLQKYLYYLVVFYLIIYCIFYFYHDIISLISTNRYNGFRSFTSVKDQYFSRYFTYRLGITHTEPSFSGLYVLIFAPLIFLKSKYSGRLKILVPLFFLFNSSKYVVAVALIIILLCGVVFLVKLLRNRKYFILFPIFVVLLVLSASVFLYLNWEKFYNILSGQSGFSRIFSMVSGLKFFLSNFFTGMGIGQYPVYFTNNFGGTDLIKNVLIRVPSAQSMLINGLAEFGASYILFILFLGVFIIKAFKRDKYLFYCGVILLFNLNASAGNGFNMIYYWVLLTFFTFYAWGNKEIEHK
tara:strand:+ start:888 stop:2237 length:1350 start_codon:yes stop_codon:yes gene_type:complete